MKIEKIRITGFRGFKDFEITSSELSDFIILAGQNGTGKSTILEVTNFLLTSVDTNQIDESMVSGITEEKAIWEVSASLSENEVLFLSKLLPERNPQAFPSSETTLKQMKGDLKQQNNRYFFTTQLTIPSDFPRQRLSRTFSGANDSRDIPSWFSTLGNYLAVYVNPLQDIGEGGLTFLGGAQKEIEMGEVTSTEFDIRKRTARTNIQLGNLLNRLAMMDIWEVFAKGEKEFPKLTNAFTRINEMIFPLELSFDRNQIEKGEIRFRMINKKVDKSYPIQFASSGERQVIGLAAMLIQWERQEFKPVVLIDEPDIHLHPEYVTRLAEFMGNIFSQAENFTCLIATHSSDFIFANVENVYQITTDSTSIEKVDNLDARVQLLINSLGKKFDLAFLIKKIFYVEGVGRSKNKLEDYKVYQRLIDPNKNKVVFLPAGTTQVTGSGSKGGVIKASNLFKAFIEEISQQPTELQVNALVDKDTETQLGSIRNNIWVTPFRKLENIFILDLKAVAEAASSEPKKFDKEEIKHTLEDIESGSTSNPLAVDGEKLLKELYDKIAKDYSEIKNLGYKGFQERILKNIKTRSLPTAVRDFFDKIKEV